MRIEKRRLIGPTALTSAGIIDQLPAPCISSFLSIYSRVIHSIVRFLDLSHSFSRSSSTVAMRFRSLRSAAAAEHPHRPQLQMRQHTLRLMAAFSKRSLSMSMDVESFTARVEAAEASAFENDDSPQTRAQYARFKRKKQNKQDPIPGHPTVMLCA